MTNIGAVLNTFDPSHILVAALTGGICLGVIATLCTLRWSPGRRKQADTVAETVAGPLSNLFAGDTLESQLARVADPEVHSERKDRAASAVRARMFARKAAQKPIPPHRAERFEHAAVLDHIAKVMRAGTKNDEQTIVQPDASGEWEEVLLLPAPAKKGQGEARAA